MPTLIAFPSPELLSGVIALGTITVPKVNVVSFVAGIVLLGLLTRVRDAHDAGAVDAGGRRGPAAARLMGININRVIATAFAIGAGLAAVAGLLYAVQAGQINPYMGFTPVLKAFIAAVIGGFGSIAGAVLGGYVLGFLEVLLTALAGIGDLLPPGSVPPEVRGVPQTVAAELARQLPRRVCVRRPDPGAARPAAGDPRQARPGRPVSGLPRRPDLDRRRAAGPLLVIAPVVDRPGHPRRERPGVLAGAGHQPRALHHPDGQPQPHQRLHRRVLAGPDRVHGAGRVRVGDPDPAARRRRRPTCRTCRPGSPASTSTSSSARSRSGSWRRR